MTKSSVDYPIITLDGGAATGKSSTAKGVSARLSFLHVDTGSHYRALTYVLLRRKIPARESGEMSRALEKLYLSAEISGTHATLLADDEKLTPSQLRCSEVNKSVSSYAALDSVRYRLLRYQRWHRELAIGKEFGGLIMEGRDIGSVVFPDAPFRFFLEADTETRIRRRSEEGQDDSVVARDQADSGRKNAPLLCPEGAIRINSGKLTLQEVVDTICETVKSSIVH